MLRSKAAEDAIKLAIPNPKERNKLTAELKRQERRLSKLETEKANIMRAIRHGAISDDDAADDMADIREQTLEAKNIIKQIEYKLNQMPDADDKMTKIAMDTLRQIIRSRYRNPSRILEMDFDRRRQFLKTVFDGKKNCIYLFKDDTKPNAYTFKLKWIFTFDEIDRVPMPSGEIMELLQLDKNEYAELLKSNQLISSFA